MEDCVPLCTDPSDVKVISNQTFQDIPTIPGANRQQQTTDQEVSVLTPTTTCHFLSHLGQPRSLDEVIQFTERRVSGKTLDVPEEVLRLCLKQTPEE